MPARNQAVHAFFRSKPEESDQRLCPNQLFNASSLSCRQRGVQRLARTHHRLQLCKVRHVIAANVRRFTLNRRQFSHDGLLVRRQLLGQRRELSRQGCIFRLRCQFLRPVHREIELAAAVVQLPVLGDGFLLFSSSCPVAASSVFARTLARALPVLIPKSSSDTASARNSPSESQRKWFSSTSCLTCFGAEPPAPVSYMPPPAINGTMESILALVPSSMIGNRSVR